MSEFAFDASGLPAYQREEAASHLDRTYHLVYGGKERQEALFFRLSFGDPAVIRSEPPAVFLRNLAAALRSGLVRLEVGGMGKADRYRVSGLLAQSALRIQGSNDPRDTPVADCLDALRSTWDSAASVKGTRMVREARSVGWKG